MLDRFIKNIDWAKVYYLLVCCSLLITQCIKHTQICHGVLRGCYTGWSLIYWQVLLQQIPLLPKLSWISVIIVNYISYNVVLLAVCLYIFLCEVTKMKTLILISNGKRQGLSFEQTWILFTQEFCLKLAQWFWRRTFR